MRKLVPDDLEKASQTKGNCVSYFESIRPEWGDVLTQHIEEVEKGETEPPIYHPGYYKIKTFENHGRQATSIKIFGNEKPKTFAWYV